MSATVVGIDIGSASVRAVEVRNANKAKPSIVKSHELALAPGSVRRGEVLDVTAVAETLKRLWSEASFGTKDVVLGMGGPRVLSRNLSLPKAPLAQMKESLPFHVQEMLPVPVTDTLLDFYPIAEVPGESGPMIRGLLVAAIKVAVSANVQAVTKAGLKPVDVDLIPFGLVRALAPAEPGLAAIVSIGADTTNIMIVLDGVPQFVRIIAAGGDDTTRALATRLEIEHHEAELIKREIGLARSGYHPERREAAEIVYEVTGELITSIRNTLSYYINTNPGSSLGQIVLSGGGSWLPGLTRTLSELTSLPTRNATPTESAQPAREGRNAVAPDRQESLTTAFALTLGAGS